MPDDILAGGNASTAAARTPDPAPSPTPSAHTFASGNSSHPGDEYDNVTLGGGGDLGDGEMAARQSRSSWSAPSASASASASDAAFLGAVPASAAIPSAPSPPASAAPASYPPPSLPVGGYSAESAYPPLPSFSRPSSAGASPRTAARYPPLRATLARLRAVLHEQSPSLHDTLAPGLAASPLDPAVSSLRAALAPYELPRAVLDSYLEHDGQESLMNPSSGGGAAGGARVGGLGLVYGLWWLPLDQVEQEWRFWRQFERAGGLQGPGLGGDAFAARVPPAAPRGGRAHPYAGAATLGDGGSTAPGMSAFPEGWVRPCYSHPGWLPLLSDRCGNYIGVDLDPPPPPVASPTSPSAAPGRPAAPARTYGQPGQVIAFGREIDTKVVLFPGDGPGGWARFLAAFVDDVERGEFARLGERPGVGVGDGAGEEEERSRPWDEEERQREPSSGGRRDDEEEEAEDDDWRGAQDDGLGDRGYFETDVVGHEVVGSGPGARSAQTWVLRTEYRRMAARLDLPGGVIGLLCERSRRKWRSLGVGSNVPQPRGILPMRVPTASSNTASASSSGAGRSLSVVVPSSSVTGVEAVQKEGEEEPQSAATERPPPLAPPIPVVGDEIVPTTTTTTSVTIPADSSVAVVLSPPSPTVHRTSEKPPPHDSSGSGPPGANNHKEDGRLAGSPGSTLSPRRREPASPRTRPPPPAPPPPSALDLPTFADLDFSDAEGRHRGGAPSSPDALTASPLATSSSSWLLGTAIEGRQALAGVGAAALQRLGFRSGSRWGGKGRRDRGGDGGGGAASEGMRSPSLLPVSLSRTESDEQRSLDPHIDGGGGEGQGSIALTLRRRTEGDEEEGASSSRTSLVRPEEAENGPSGPHKGEDPVRSIEVIAHQA